MQKSKIFSVTFCIPILLFLASAQIFGQNINHFEISFSIKPLTDRYPRVTTFTDKQITIFKFNSVLSKKDTTVLFTRTLMESDSLRQIGEIDLSKLKIYYSNRCIEDGFKLTITIKKDGQEKLVHISNYYPDDIAKILYLINSLVPEMYKVSYYKQNIVTENNPCIVSNK